MAFENSARANQELVELGAVPIDKMAWRVIAPGEHYERPARLTQLCFDYMPPTVRRTANHDPRLMQQVTDDLRGIRFGHLTAIGYWGRKSSGKKGTQGRDGQLWACRCLCGLFTLRTAKTITKQRDIEHPFPPMCNACAVEKIVKQGFTYAEARSFVLTDPPIPSETRIAIAQAMGIYKRLAA